MNLISYLLLFLVLIIISVTTIYIYFIYSFSYWRKKGVPYLEPSFPFGNFARFIKTEISHGSLCYLLYRELKTKTKTFGGLYIMPHAAFMPIDPNLIKHMLTTNFHKFHDRGVYYNEINDPLVANLATLDGKKWKNIRNKVAPAFTSGKLKNMTESFNKSCVEISEVLNKASEDKKSIDTNDIMTRFTMDNICRILFGIECNSLLNSNAEFRTFIQIIKKASDIRRLGFASKYTTIYKCLRIKVVPKEIATFFMNVLKETVNFREENQIHSNDILEIMIQMKNNTFVAEGEVNGNNTILTFEQLAGEAFGFFIAGYETTASTFTFCLTELALNQTIQDKLREEINQIFEKYGGDVSYDATVEMVYMDKVISEIWRKYPVIPVLHRICTQAYQIPGSDLIIEKGTDCIISLLGIHMDPEYFPEPEKFDPERFSEEEKAKRPPFTYLPFGDGPRTCLGQRFAVLQIKICLARILHTYKFTLDSRTKIPLEMGTKGFALYPKDKIFLHVSKLTNISGG